MRTTTLILQMEAILSYRINNWRISKINKSLLEAYHFAFESN